MMDQQLIKDRAIVFQKWALREKAKMDELPKFWQKNLIHKVEPDQIQVYMYYIDQKMQPQIHFNSKYTSIWIGLYV